MIKNRKYNACLQQIAYMEGYENSTLLIPQESSVEQVADLRYKQ